MLLYGEVLPLALAGAAAVAMRTAAQALSRTIYETNHLYEASFFLAIYRSCLDDARTRRRTAPTALSGGQWQRISVARGLYRDAPW